MISGKETLERIEKKDYREISMQDTSYGGEIYQKVMEIQR